VLSPDIHQRLRWARGTPDLLHESAVIFESTNGIDLGVRPLCKLLGCRSRERIRIRVAEESAGHLKRSAPWGKVKTQANSSVRGRIARGSRRGQQPLRLHCAPLDTCG